MLDWTGERFVPWAKEPSVAYEHLHRYLWASGLVRGKRVLDLASGEGYGADMLAQAAESVCGVDIDEDSILHASAKYNRPNLRFLKGSLIQVPISEEDAFDVIVCFEAIEHIREHEELMREVKRLLKPEGVFIVSTPNKQAYRVHEPQNPFHVKELTFTEFNALLTRNFANVGYLGQSVHPGSTMWPIGNEDGSFMREFDIQHVSGEFQLLTGKERVAIYFIAVASDGGGVACQGSVLLDHSNELLNIKDAEAQSLREHLQQRDASLHELERTVTARDEALARQARQIDVLKTEIEMRSNELTTIYESRAWKLVSRLRAVKAWLSRRQATSDRA